MFWLFFPLVSSFCSSLSSFFDNYLVDVHCRKLNAMCLMSIYAVLDLIICAVLLIWKWDVITSSGIGWDILSVFLMAALISFMGNIPYYKALKKDDTTDVALLSQVTPVIALVLGIAFLNETISLVQLASFLLILCATLFIILSFGKKRIKLGLKVSMLVIAACFFWVLSDIMFVIQARELDFAVCFFWLMLCGVVVRAGALLVMKSWRREMKKFLKKNRFKKISALVTNEAIWLVGTIAWRYGIVIMPIAMMSVVKNVSQLIITFVMGIILTAIWPKFGREKISKKVVINHAVATGILVVAIVMIS